MVQSPFLLLLWFQSYSHTYLENSQLKQTLAWLTSCSDLMLLMTCYIYGEKNNNFSAAAGNLDFYS